MRNTKIIISFLLLVLLSNCVAQDKEKEITIRELLTAKENDSSLVIIDVRTKGELSGPLGHIEGVINIPLQEIEQRIGEFEEYKNSNIALICRTGNRSGIATSILSEKGLKVKNVIGGMVEYRKIGY